MSFPLFVQPFRETPKAKLIPEGLFTSLDTSQGSLHIGKQPFAWIVYKIYQNFGKNLLNSAIPIDPLLNLCVIKHPELELYGKPFKCPDGCPDGLSKARVAQFGMPYQAYCN